MAVNNGASAIPRPHHHMRSASIISSSSFLPVSGLGNGTALGSSAASSSNVSVDGYSKNVFDGKASQIANVARIIDQQGFIPKDLIQNEVSWFYK